MVAIEELLWQFHYELNATQKIFFIDKAGMRFAKAWLKRINKRLDKDYKDLRNDEKWSW